MWRSVVGLFIAVRLQRGCVTALLDCLLHKEGRLVVEGESEIKKEGRVVVVVVEM